MRILQVIRSTDPASGGPIEVLIRWSEMFEKYGHEIEVVSLDAIKEVTKRQFPFSLTALGRGVGRFGFNLRLSQWIRRNAQRFDVVILHGLWNYSSLGAWLGLRGQSTPYMIFAHGMLDPWFRMRYPLKTFLKQLYWLVAEGKVLRDAQRVLFSCEEEQRRARCAFYGYDYRGMVVHYGTTEHRGDSERESEAFFRECPNLKDARYLLFMGRIHPIKACDSLIHGFAACIRDIPENVYLVVAGPDQVGWMTDLQSLAAREGIADRVVWPGMLKGDYKWGALRNADALILPSHQDSFGIVVAEAMACGTPVLISDKVNTWREVESSRGGFIAPDTEKGVVELIRKLYSLSAEERVLLASRARQGFQDNFDLSHAAEDLEWALSDNSVAARRPVRDGLRILHVIRSTEAATGGPIEWLYRLSEELERTGHSIEIVSLEDREELMTRTLPFRVTALGKGFGKYSFNWRLTPWMRRNAYRFDIVIMHGLWNYSSFGVWRGLRRSQVPYLIFPHGMMDPWFRDHYPMKHIKKRVYWRLAEGRVLRDAKEALFTCDEERERARGVFGHFAYQEKVVRLGTIDPQADRERQRSSFYFMFPHLRKRRFLLFLSRIHPKKGCDVLIEAFAACANRIPQDVDLLIVGPDKHSMVPKLQLIARKFGVSARVHWSGMLSGDSKWGAFRCAEALAFPSHQENFGFVVAESMACGTPVLISDKVNIWREVQASGGGLIAPDRVEETKNLILQYFAMTDESRSQMREAARAGFLRYFSIGNAASELLSTIENALAVSESQHSNVKREHISV